MATPSDPGRNLLFGVLALQLNFISREALIAATSAWVLDKSRPLGALLIEQGAVAPETRAMLESLVDQHLRMHDGDPERSLAAIGPIGVVHDELQQIADIPLQNSLAQFRGAGSGGNGDETTDETRTWTHDPPDRAAGSLRFRIVRPHARGGIGQVSVAIDTELNREVALKEILPDRVDEPESRARFLLEAEVTGSLEHPGIVPVYSLGADAQGRPFYAMRLVKGESFKEAIKRFHATASGTRARSSSRILLLRELLARFIAVCNAVAYAHSRGVLHRDLKPSNILLGPYGETLLVDWGLAKVVGRDEVESTSAETTLRPSSSSVQGQTQAGAAVGTPAYMSPEQAEGRLDRLGPASDVYSLGATLYCLFTGRPPFEGDDLAGILAGVRTGSFPRPREIDGLIPPALEAICLKAMALRPEDRYPSAKALAGEIERWLADEPVSACRDPWSIRASRWARRHKPLVAAAGALLIAAVVGLSIGIVAVKKEQQQTEAQRVALKDKSDELSWNVQSLRRKDYINRVNLALRECEDDNVPFADQLLDGCPEDLRRWEWNYVKRQCHLELKTLAARPLEINSVALSPDGRRIASGTGQMPWELWNGKSELMVRDVATGREIFAEPDLRGNINALAFSPDGRWMVSGNLYGGGDGSTDVILWDTSTGRRKWLKAGINTRIVKIKFTPDGLRIVAGFTGFRGNYDHRGDTSQVKIWDVATGTECRTLPLTTGSLYSLDISPDGKQVALACFGGIVEVRELERLTLVHSLQSRQPVPYDVAFSPDGRTLASGGDDRLIFWNRATGRELRTFAASFRFLQAIRFSSDSSRLLTWDQHGGTKLWDVANERSLSILHSNRFVRCVDYAPSSGLLASGSSDGAVKLWYPTSSHQLLLGIRRKRDEVRAAFSSDGGTVITTSGRLQWSARNGERRHVPVPEVAATSRPPISPDGTKSVAVNGQYLEIRDDRTGTVALRLEAPGPITRWAFSPDGTRIVVLGSRTPRSGGDPGREALVCEIPAGKSFLVLSGHTDLVRDVAYSPDGRRIATVSDDRTMKLWDAMTGEEVLTLRGHAGAPVTVAFSPEGDQIVTGDTHTIARIWETKPPDLDVLRQREAVAMVESLATSGVALKSDLIHRLSSDPNISEPLRPVALEIAWRRDGSKDWPAMWSLEVGTRVAAENARDVVGTLQVYQQVLARRRALAAEHPDDLELRSDQAMAHWAIAHLHSGAGRVTEALREFRRVRDIHEDLTRLDPDATGYLYALACATWNIANMHQRLGQTEEALRCHERGRDHFEKLLKFHGEICTHICSNLNLSYAYIGRQYRSAGRLQEASTAFSRGLELGEIWHPGKTGMKDPAVRRLMVPHCFDLGALREAVDQPAEALRLFHRARELLESLPDKNASVSTDLALAYQRIGTVQHRLGQSAEALRSFQRSRDICEKLVEADRKNAPALRGLAFASDGMGRVHDMAGRLTEALRSFKQTREILEELPRKGNTDLYNLACAYSLESKLLERSKGPLGSNDRLERERLTDLGMSALQQAVREGWKNAQHANQDSDLNPLRSRPDFQILMMDMAFPDRPFAR